ncbi:MAG: hypothetical protein DHS20C05_03800 [Hyphococcus sp.]|nr:MAG: hypothetical protein DHS20C05_03800 [Marinicaulis sp.]
MVFNIKMLGAKSGIVMLTLLAAACGKSYDTEITGEMSYMPMLGADSLLVEYEPTKFAVVYAGDDTKLVNINRTDAGIVWTLGGDVIVRGDKTESVEDFADDGVVYMTNSNKGDQVIDLWINASYVKSVKVE